MTIEKAIEILELSRDIVEDAGKLLGLEISSDGREAFNMAISVLKEKQRKETAK